MQKGFIERLGRLEGDAAGTGFVAVAHQEPPYDGSRYRVGFSPDAGREDEYMDETGLDALAASMTGGILVRVVSREPERREVPELKPVEVEQAALEDGRNQSPGISVTEEPQRKGVWPVGV